MQVVESNWYPKLKYAVYLLLSFNVLVFFREEWLAADHLFEGAIPFAELIVAFAASIDTLAWVILLLLFELETYQIPDEKLTPTLSRSIHTVRALCYAVIVYSFYGYLSKALAMNAYQLADTLDACTLGVTNGSLMIELDEFLNLGADNCLPSQVGDALYRLGDSAIVAYESVLQGAKQLAWLDVINSGTWLVIVALLELDVRIGVYNRVADAWQAFSKWAKYLAYTILFAAAVYWGFNGDFIDFWDAFLWLFAFAFIEMNVIEWRDERHGDTQHA